MENRNNWLPLKLRAEDDNDLQVFSQCIFEAIVVPTEIHYYKKEKELAMAIERFTWESAGGQDHKLQQVLAVLIIQGVEKVNFKNIFKKNTIKNILSISNIDNNILILLNDEEIITLNVGKWRCILEDIGNPIYPPTVPNHLKND